MFASNGAAATFLRYLLNKSTFNFLDVTDKIRSLTDELSVPEFYINTDGSLSIEEQRINLSELSISVGTFFEEISEDCSAETVLSRLARLKKPVQRVVIWIFNYIIINFFASVMAGLFILNLQNYLDSNSLNSRREVTQAIKNIPCEIDLDDYKDYRVVTADILNLRQKPSMSSNVIAQLKRGKLVRIIQKKKNWTKVEFERSSNSTGAQVGWVATRYIVPLKR